MGGKIENSRSQNVPQERWDQRMPRSTLHEDGSLIQKTDQNGKISERGK